MFPCATSFKSDLTQGSIMKMNIFFHNYANKDMPIREWQNKWLAFSCLLNSNRLLSLLV